MKEETTFGKILIIDDEKDILKSSKIFWRMLTMKPS